MRRRLFDPRSFIEADTEARIAALPVYAWDVVTAHEFLSALRVEDKMVANRWLYRAPQGLPPFEPPGKWVVGSGAPRVIRKDCAMAWAGSGGLAVTGQDCWPYASDDLARLGWRGLGSSEDVQSVFSFLLDHSIIRFRYPLRVRRDGHHLYAGLDDNRRPEAHSPPITHCFGT